ncbi:ribosomal protein S18-alanine N-acetyltransferase [Nocardioides houyundeii]|uniref:ribosomal protein S18-alanine N-acetyltransferase n=1 Tax=Nocardioides houyundeii TaxID=2045452 RepID=UPI000DF396EE|nr:ribosomal protein S18-alanine N-acetyltransferase [Nocardioides houyundeii]
MIVPVGEHDLDQVGDLEDQLFGEQAWSAQAFAELAAGPGRRAWVARTEDGTVLGYVLTGHVGDFAELLRIGVRAGAQRRGTATALLATAVDAAAADGAERMLLEVSTGNDSARALYARSGFEQIDRRPRYYADGSDALVLQLQLQPAAHRSERMAP